jgi:hypothetical protein
MIIATTVLQIESSVIEKGNDGNNNNHLFFKMEGTGMMNESDQPPGLI